MRDRVGARSDDRIHASVDPRNQACLALLRSLGMRQEAVTISTGNVPANGITIPGQVETCEPDFVHRTQLVYIQNGRSKFSGFCPLDLALETGHSVRAQVDPERLYFFDTNSGLRLG